MGRGVEWGGGVHPPEDTATSHASAASALAVQHAIQHAYDVSEGRALPTNTTVIAPNFSLLSPPPHLAPSLLGSSPTRTLTPAEK